MHNSIYEMIDYDKTNQNNIIPPQELQEYKLYLWLTVPSIILCVCQVSDLCQPNICCVLQGIGGIMQTSGNC